MSDQPMIESVSEELFPAFRDARYEFRRPREDDEQVMPRYALGNLSPAEFMKRIAQQQLGA